MTGKTQIFRAASARVILAWSLSFSVVACGAFIKGSTPIGGVAEADREVVTPGLNEPEQIRLKRAAEICGVALTAGSLVKRSSNDAFRLIPAEPTKAGGIPVPAHSEIEVVRSTSTITGDSFAWNGVVHMGGAARYGTFDVEQDDRVFFASDATHGTTIAQLQLARDREVHGVPSPAGTIFDIDANGKVTSSYTPIAQRQLAAEREAREQRLQGCKTRCAVVTDPAENNRCLDQCMR